MIASNYKKKTFMYFFHWNFKTMWSRLLLISILQMKKPRFSEVQSYTLHKYKSSLYSNPYFSILNTGFFPLVYETYIKKGLLMTKVLFLSHSLGPCMLSHLSTAKAKEALLYHPSNWPLFPSPQCHEGSFFTEFNSCEETIQRVRKWHISSLF